jgi:hypothetical protein
MALFGDQRRPHLLFLLEAGYAYETSAVIFILEVSPVNIFSSCFFLFLFFYGYIECRACANFVKLLFCIVYLFFHCFPWLEVTKMCYLRERLVWGCGCGGNTPEVTLVTAGRPVRYLLRLFRGMPSF